MNLQELKQKCKATLASEYENIELNSLMSILFEHITGWDQLKQVLNKEQKLPQVKIDQFHKALTSLQEGMPIQYIIGKAWFMGHEYIVNENVLIPRPETEELVSWIIDELKVEDQKSKVTILDIGTGSGCIPISLAKNISNATIYALDISSEALKTAKTNAELNNVTIEFIEADILNLSKLPQQFDIIVSNPPYVRALEKEQMQENVLKNEPHVALFVEDNNPLLFYDKISDLAKHHLSKSGQLYFEINQYLGKETIDLLASKGFKNIVLKKDMFGADRMVRCSF